MQTPQPTSTAAAGDILWTPSAEVREASAMTALMRDVGVADYEALWRWSVEDVGRFWGLLWKRFDIQADGDPSVALADATMPGARWFPDVALSMPEHVFRGRDGDAVAIRFAGEGVPLTAWTWDELRAETGRVRVGLQRMGVGRGNRVVGYLPNGPHTIAAFLAVASLGATWSCCSPDFGTRTVIDRFAQIEPVVLLTCDGYRYNGKAHDRTAIADEIAAALPTLKHTVRLPYLGRRGNWDDAFPPTDEPLQFERVPFDHPLWILYSSGTTGLPKAIVHGHGGILLEHLKVWRIGQAVGPEDRVLWTTTTGWVMWNLVVGVLLSDASIVIYEGSVAHPDLDVLWRLIDEAGITVFGTGAAYLHGCLKAGLPPKQDHDLSRLRAVGSTGSPLSPEGFCWVYDHVGPDTWLFSTSGGTDIASSFVGGCDILAVRAGELQARCLGVAAEAWDDDGRALVDEVGELVITKPMPSMPVGFWNDPGDVRYRESYFEHFDVQPPVWRQGDWVRITQSGSSVIYGRSDSTINRGGIRMGTAEIYAAVLALDAITDALVVDVPPPDGNADSRMSMFVVLSDGAVVDDALTKQVIAAVRRDASPRHVPDELIAVPEIPRTLTGKVLEVPVKKLLMGRDPETVVSRDALANPEAFDWFVQHARNTGPTAPSDS
ncbi:MAG: acetoacetate--CoA ligase [Conexibacter sp.]|nr:acetoacetate--CoA ligase [Conexibacter sp.]